MHKIDIDIAGDICPVRIGHDILGELGGQCRDLGLGRQVALVSDEVVAERYLQPAAESLRAAGFQVLEVVYAGGEGSKNLEGAEGIFTRLIEAEFDRGTWLAALGGGVVGDMSGFVASTYLRGIPCVQVPTTIVSQVDSSIGGKTGVNHALGKNLIGAFSQPRLVLIDTDMLRSLPRREVVGGMAEVVKHALIRDEEMFHFLEDRLDEIVAMELDAETLDWLIARNVGIKAAVVAEDEKEGGLRAILNYGHTIGHAIEAATDYGRYKRRRQDTLLERLGVPDGLSEVGAERILERTKADKKRVDGRSRLILGRRVGEVEIVEGVEDDVVRSGIEYVQQRY
jgi:3-dehydroquinate synthase